MESPSSDTIVQRIDKIKESQIHHVQSISMFLVWIAKYLEDDSLLLTSTNVMNSNLNPIEMGGAIGGSAREVGGSTSATETSALDFVKCYTELRNRVNTTLLDRQRRVLSNLKSFVQGLAVMHVDGNGNRVDGVDGDGLAVSKASMLWATFFKEVGTGYQSNILAGGKVTGGGGSDFGKWQSSFFKAMGKINDSITRLLKYKESNNLKKKDKEESVLLDLVKKWDPLADDFCKICDEMKVGFDAWWRGAVGDELLATVVSTHDYWNDGIVSLQKLMAKNAGGPIIITGNQSDQSQGQGQEKLQEQEHVQKEKSNGVAEVDEHGYTIRPPQSLQNDPFKPQQSHDSSDDENEKGAGGVIQVAIKDKVIEDDEMDKRGAVENVMRHLAIGEAVQFKSRSRAGTGTPGVAAGAGSRRTSGRPAASSSLTDSSGMVHSGSGAINSPLPMQLVEEDETVGSPLPVESPVPTATSRNLGPQSFHIKIVETWNCLIDASGTVDKVLLTGQVSLIKQQQSSGTIPAGTRIVLLYDSGVIDKIVENGDLLDLCLEKGAAGGYLLKKDIEWRDDSDGELNDQGVPVFKYLVKQEATLAAIPFNGTVFWKRNSQKRGEEGPDVDCVVDLLIMYRHSSQLIQSNENGVRVCARLGGSGDVGRVESEPVVEWDLDSRLLAWNLGREDNGTPTEKEIEMDGGRIVCRIEASVPGKDIHRDVDVYFEGRGWSVGCLGVQAVLDGDHELGKSVDYGVQVEYQYQTGVYQLMGNLIE